MSPEFVELALCSIFGLAIGLFAYTLFSTYRKAPKIPDDAPSTEADRRKQLCENSPIFKNFQSLILGLASANLKIMSPSSIAKLNHAIATSGREIPWKAEEYLAAKQIEAALAGVIVGLLLAVMVAPLAGMIAFMIVTFVYYYTGVSNIGNVAADRSKSFKMRLPFTVDLMALMLEAGATFQDALETVVRENGDHPIGKEFGLVARQISLGRRRAEALESLHQRLPDQDIYDLVFAINKGEELGTPLAKLLRDQAEQMRLKRSQWGEKAAAEAEVKLSFPGFIVMIACILIVVAPIMMPILSNFGLV